ncbi:MAG: hypothetical protein LBC92_00910 [Rickettsiales bacterium]|jgi:hypothetical protein|nr:hypothetical protein [Rickettsiales bacterium]
MSGGLNDITQSSFSMNEENSAISYILKNEEYLKDVNFFKDIRSSTSYTATLAEKDILHKKQIETILNIFDNKSKYGDIRDVKKYLDERIKYYRARAESINLFNHSKEIRAQPRNVRKTVKKNINSIKSSLLARTSKKNNESKKHQIQQRPR